MKMTKIRKVIRNNIINFIVCNNEGKSERKYSLINGSFYIKDHKVTLGQPSGIENGDTLFCDSDGKFNFQVGRKASKDVANWFNDKCNPRYNTTYGRPAKKLNFAFIGTLQLTISHELKEYTVLFDNILIAQSSTCMSNDWWFGGKTCFKIKNNKVTSNGSTKNKNNFRFTFLRGRNTNDHTVEITNIEFFTWMNNIDENKLLSQINLPGTHDSATYKFNEIFLSNFVKTQNLSIREQLNLGIRYLDIRCRHINNTFAIHHDRFYVNLMFDVVLEQCISFLSEHESESIIMLIKEEHDPKGNTREFYETFLFYANKNKEYWYHKNTIPSIKEARKKIVLMHRFDFKENSFGIDCIGWEDNKTFVIENFDSSLMIQDEYSVSLTVKSKAIKELVKNSFRREKYWYLNFISLASTLFRTVVDTAKSTNGIINKIAKEERTGFLGLIIMDYPNYEKGLTSLIIDNNNFI